MSIILFSLALFIYILENYFRSILNKSQNKSGIPIEFNNSNSEARNEKVNNIRICNIIINDSSVKDHD